MNKVNVGFEYPLEHERKAGGLVVYLNPAGSYQR